MSTQPNYDERFTREEAQAKLGRQIRNPREFSGVPKWTRGTVVEIDKVGNGYDLVVEWDMPSSPPLIATGEIAGERFTFVRRNQPLQD